METKTNSLTNIQIQLRVTGYHHYYINRVVLLLREKLKANFPNATLHQAFLPEQYERFTLLRSPHVDKKARDQFSRNIQTRLITLNIKTLQLSITLRDLNKLFGYLNDSLIGVGISVRTTLK